MKRLITVAIALLALGGCTDDAGPQVTITAGRQFDPATLTIEAGQSVMWVNESDEQHTITAYTEGIPEEAPYFASGGHDSQEEARQGLAEGLFGPGDAVSIGFETAGTYEYYCIPHEDQGMRGKIVVED